MGEPLWLPEDTELALQWIDDQQALCPGGCGQYRAESMDPATEGKWTAESVRCHACTARNAAAEQFENSAGLFFAVTAD